jgi:hypothetical protein
MDDDTPNGFEWPAAFARQFREAGEQAMEGQREFYERMLPGAAGDGYPFASLGTATFKARVQSGGRISIPDAERAAHGSEEGDLVQTVVVPIRKGETDE